MLVTLYSLESLWCFSYFSISLSFLYSPYLSFVDLLSIFDL